MSEISRRLLLRSTGITLAGVPAMGQTHHHAGVAAPEAQRSRPRFLQPHEFATLEVLCDLIIPADEHSPAAREAGAAEYIDLLAGNNPQIANIFRGGIAWLNARSTSLFGEPFTESSPERQMRLLEEIADLDKVQPSLKAGAIFFDWARRMTMDAFYTSKVGIQDLGYLGNQALSRYEVPSAVLEQALHRFERS
jgi:hypothetical protein